MAFVHVPIYNILNPPQRDFATCTATFRNIGGAKGGGKSHAVRREIATQSLGAPGVRGLCLRRRYRDVINNTLEPLQREMAQVSVALKIQTQEKRNSFFDYKQTDHIAKWHNGSTTQFGYCKNMKDVEQYRGIEYDFIAIEELQQWKYQEIQELMSCLRSTNPRIRPNIFGSCNPGGIGHQWIKRLFINREFEDGEDPSDFAFIPARIWDNPILLQNDPAYLRRLQALPDILRRAYLEGDWDVFTGQFFSEWRRGMHVCEPHIPLQGVRRRIVAFDYGYTAPSAVYWMAQMENGMVYVYRELYVTKHNYRQLAAKIRAMTTEVEEIDAYFCDPAILNKQDGGTTAKQDFAGFGIKLKGANNDRLDGWQTVRGYLQPTPLPNGVIVPHLQITANCHNLISTLPEMVHDDVRVEDINTLLEDHAVDALRYGLKALGKVSGTVRDMEEINNLLYKQAARTMESTQDYRSSKPRHDDDRRTALNMIF